MRRPKYLYSLWVVYTSTSDVAGFNCRDEDCRGYYLRLRDIPSHYARAICCFFRYEVRKEKVLHFSFRPFYRDKLADACKQKTFAFDHQRYWFITEEIYRVPISLEVCR